MFFRTAFSFFGVESPTEGNAGERAFIDFRDKALTQYLLFLDNEGINLQSRMENNQQKGDISGSLLQEINEFNAHKDKDDYIRDKFDRGRFVLGTENQDTFQIAPQMALLISKNQDNYFLSLKIGSMVVTTDEGGKVKTVDFSDYFKKQKFVMTGLQPPDDATLRKLKEIILPSNDNLEKKYDNSFELAKEVIKSYSDEDFIEAYSALFDCLKNNDILNFGLNRPFSGFPQWAHFIERSNLGHHQVCTARIFDRVSRLYGSSQDIQALCEYSPFALKHNQTFYGANYYKQIGEGDVYMHASPDLSCAIPLDSVTDVTQEYPSTNSEVFRLIQKNYQPPYISAGDVPVAGRLTKSANKR